MYQNKLVGVANFVSSGCGSNSPDGYAKVSFFYNWIQNHILLSDTSDYTEDEESEEILSILSSHQLF